MLMGVATFLIGVIPTHATIGLAAPVILTFLRLIQGIGVGGEWGGSVLLSMEWGSAKRRGFMASWPQVGVPLGLLASTGMVKLMSSATGESFETWGWRVPFLASILLVAVGLYVRLRVMESPDFAAVRQTQTVVKRPVWEVIRTQPREILTSAFVRMSEQAPFYPRLPGEQRPQVDTWRPVKVGAHGRRLLHCRGEGGESRQRAASAAQTSPLTAPTTTSLRWCMPR